MFKEPFTTLLQFLLIVVDLDSIQQSPMHVFTSVARASVVREITSCIIGC